MTVIKGKYPDTDAVRKHFKHQGSIDTCLPTSIHNVLTEFLEREGIILRVSSKDIRSTLYKKGPYGQIALKDYAKNLTRLLKGEQIKAVEIFHQPSLIPTPVERINTEVDMGKLAAVCQNVNMSFPYVTVSGSWFGEFGLDSWADPENGHVLIVIDVDIERDKVEFFDPAEKFFTKSSKVKCIPKFINPDKFLSYWDEYKLPRLTGWFERTEKPLTEW